MHKKTSERRLVENEAVFREYNLNIQHGFDELKTVALDEGESPPNLNIRLHFYCECSDEKCKERITVSMETYKSIHKNNLRFFVLPGHETTLCESIVKTTRKYYIVQKFMTPPEKPQTLHKTTLNNA